MILEEKQKIHLAQRTSFGVNVEVLNGISQLGMEGYLQQQLNPHSIPLSDKVRSHLKKYDYLDLTVEEIFNQYHQDYLKRGDKNKLSGRKIGEERRKFFNDSIAFKVINSVHNPRQLEDVMTDFWFSHFNVFAHKMLSIQRFLMHNYEQKTIRPHALGKFKDLLIATAKHPAMLFYLDNWRNVKPNNLPGRAKRGLNENYARELMELHTLGVDGGYTQEDVISLTKILTGWGVMNPNTPQREDGFFFHFRHHDNSDKVFLGQKIKGGGVCEVFQAIDILTSHPSTANHIGFKIAQYFVGDNPPPSLVKTLATNFQETDGNISSVLNTLFHSEEFWDQKYYGNKFKTPYQYVISLLRLGNINQFNSWKVTTLLDSLQMKPYQCLTPDGYKNTASAWLSPSSIIKRVDIAVNVSQGEVNPRQKVEADKIINRFNDLFSSQTLRIVESSNPALRGGLILGSPEMMYR